MLRRALFWFFLPWVVPQALRVRREAPRFGPARGPVRGSTGQGESLRLLAVGDSIVAGVGAKTTDRALACRTASCLAAALGREVSWHALGRVGANAATIRRELLPLVPAETFDVAIVSVGVNDVTSLTRTRRWRRNLVALLEAIQARAPNAVIVLAGLPPLWSFPLLPEPLRTLLGMRAKTFDGEARQIAHGWRSVVHVPLVFDPRPEEFCADGYHPSASSYAVFGELMATAAAQQLNKGQS